MRARIAETAQPGVSSCDEPAFDSTREQAHDKNFGIGAKVAAATRNHAGLLYLSRKNGEGAMIDLWRDSSSGQYGIKRNIRSDGSYVDWVRITDDASIRVESRLRDWGTRYEQPRGD